MIAALLLEPFPLWLAQREHGADGLPLAVTDAGRVLHTDAAAQARGVEAGMRVSGALSRVPELHTVPLSGPAVQAGWAAVTAQLPAYSPRVEVLGVGRALLTLTRPAASELAAALCARVGLAETRELALLAALNAPSGQVSVVGDAAAFRRALPLAVLRGVGLSAGMHERLGWLGVHTVGELLAWSRAGQAAYLGAEFATLKPYLHGANTGGVQAATPAPEVRAALSFDAPVYEPHELEAAATDLSPGLLSALGARVPTHLSVRAQVAGLTLGATRTLKESVRVPGALSRAILRALRDADAAKYGIESLEVTLSGLTLGATQPDLWNRAAAQEAAELAERRFPGVMRRVQWLDPFSLSPDAAYAWVSRLTRAAPTATAPLPAPPVQAPPRDRVAVRA